MVGLDNFLTGSPDNIAHLADNPKFSFIEHNVTEYIDVAGPVDGVLHFASPASPVDYLELPIQTLKVGSLGTLHTLGQLAAKHNVSLISIGNGTASRETDKLAAELIKQQEADEAVIGLPLVVKPVAGAFFTSSGTGGGFGAAGGPIRVTLCPAWAKASAAALAIAPLPTMQTSLRCWAEVVFMDHIIARCQQRARRRVARDAPRVVGDRLHRRHLVVRIRLGGVAAMALVNTSDAFIWEQPERGFALEPFAPAQLEAEPVSSNDVEAFYKKHPEKFGARTAYSCELLSSERPLNEA